MYTHWKLVWGVVVVASLASADRLYLPRASTLWSNASAIPFKRKAAVFEEIGAGAVVLFSGKIKDKRTNGGHMALVGDAWLLKLTARGASWTHLDVGAASPRPVPRWKSAGAGVGGKLYVFGGGGIGEDESGAAFLDDLWVLDVAPAAWTRVSRGPAAVWPKARRGHAIAAVPGAGAFVVVGGRRMHHECLRDAWVYDTASNAWSSRRMPPEHDYGCRWGHTATAVKAPGSSSDAAGGVVAVFGGRRLADDGEDYVYLNDLWFFTPATGWDLAAPENDAPPARDHHAAAAVGGRLYVHGGKLTDQAKAALGDLWCYDLATKRWTDLTHGEMPSTRYLHSGASWSLAPPVMTGHAPGAILLFGGEHIKSRHHGVKKYARKDDLWAFYPPAAGPGGGDVVNLAGEKDRGLWVELINKRAEAANLGFSNYMLRGVEAFLWAFTFVACLALVFMAFHFRFDEDSNRQVPGAAGDEPGLSPNTGRYTRGVQALVRGV